MFRHAVRLDDTTNPLTQNALGKASGPIPLNLRHRPNRKITPFTSDCKVIRKARRVFCNHSSLQGKCGSIEDVKEAMPTVYADVMAVLDNGDAALKPRLKQFLKHFLDESFFPRLFLNLWEDGRSNPGNPYAKPNSVETITENNKNVDKFVKRFQPKENEVEGDPFWIEAGQSKIELQRLKNAKDSKGGWKLIEYTDEYETLKKSN
jgi:hypothetical protein